MINNWGDCAASAESGRQPWIVSNIDQYDQENFIVNFNATLSTWDIVAANSVIEFGSMPSTVSKRDDTLQKSFGISLAHTLPQVFFSKATNSGLDFSIGCPGCATTGTINVVGKIVLSTFLKVPTGVKSISISATPQGVGANLALGFDVSGTLGSGWQKDWNLITAGLPGWQIPGILVVGPQFSVDAGFALSGISGSASISAGINVAIPDSSSAVLGITGVDSSSNGWVPTVTPQTPKVSVEVDGHLELFVEMGVDIGLTILGKYGFGGGVYLRVPDVKLDLGAEFNTQGACPGSKDVFGVTFDCTVGVNLGLGVYTESGGNKDWKANHTIYQNEALITPINKCFPLGPSLSPGASGISIKTIGTVPASTSSAKSSSLSTSSKPSSTPSKPSSTLISITKSSSSVVLSTGVSSSKISGTGVSSSSKISGTGVSSSSRIIGTGVSKVIGTGVTSATTSKQTGTGVSSIHTYGTGVSSAHSSGTGVSSSVHPSGTGVSSSVHPSGTGISSSVHQSGTVTSASIPLSTSGSSSKKPSSSSTEEGYGYSSATTSLKSTITSAVTSDKVITVSGSLASSSVLGISVSGSATASTTAKAVVTSSVSSSAAKSSSTSKAVGTLVSGSVPAPTQTGTISTCDKWVVIEDAECSCSNIEAQYGVTASQLLTWNPAIGSDCKLVIGDAYCVGVKGGYKRSVNGRLARFVDA
ncbi:hypothetical protein ACMFMG_004815 [Clarireedia jacksonii]